MFNLEKREISVILVLLAFLAIGLSVGIYQRSAPVLTVKTDAFTADRTCRGSRKR